MEQLLTDIAHIEQVLARYAVGMTKDDVEAVMDVFTPDGTYSAFGDTYAGRLPHAGGGGAQGLFLTGMPAIEFDSPDTASGEQPLCFVDQEIDHAMRIGWYTDTYRRTSVVAPGHPLDDVPPAQRGPRLGQGARPDPPQPTAAVAE